MIPMAQRVSAGFDLMHRLAKEYEKPPFGITAVRQRRRGRGAGAGGGRQALLPAAALQALHRQPQGAGRDEVAAHGAGGGAAVGPPLDAAARHRASLLHDHKVFITDWTDARMVPWTRVPFHLDDYVAYVQDFIRHIGPEVHVISVCQPTVPVLAAVSLMASRASSRRAR
jgi:poly(3-hydroxybutyrate) depolymerase